jgi:hypothetical protein
MVSVGPPVTAGTTSVIGRVGYVCALAIRENAGDAAVPAAKFKICGVQISLPQPS